MVGTSAPTGGMNRAARSELKSWRGCGAEGIVPEKPEAQGKGLIEIGNYPTKINPRRSPYQGFTAIRPWVSILLRNGRDPASLKYCSTAFTQPRSVG